MNLVSVDFQNDFVSDGGVHFNRQPCIDFVTQTVVPYTKAHGIPIAEIVSDYRTPGGDEDDTTCVPGRWGFANWLETAIGPPSRSGPVVLIGLMLEVCVLASLIEISLRGYSTSVLIEGVDCADGDSRRKSEFLNTLEGYWGKPTTWQQFTDSG